MLHSRFATESASLDADMEIHTPKHAVRTWRDFLKEVGVIVLGVLIALGAEQTVEKVREHTASADTRRSVRSEIAANLLLLNVRAASQGCIDRRLQEIGTILASAGDGVPEPHPTWVSRPEFWSLSSSSWQAATGAGRAALLSEEEQRTLGSYYNVFEYLDREQEREQQAWAQLRALEDWQGALRPSARLGFALALQQARYSEYRIRAKTISLLAEARVDRIQVPARSVVHATSICLAITTPRAEAERVDHAPLGDPR